MFPDAPDERETLEVLGRIQAGDPSGWDDLYRRYHDELLFAVRNKMGAKLRSKLQSEDVLQSVALEAFRALPRFEDRGEGSLRRFLHTLVLNKLRDRADTFAAAKRAGDVALTDAIASGATASSPPSFYDHRFDRLEACLDALPEDMREVLILRKIEDRSSREIAEMQGKSDAAVRKLYSRALARVSQLMRGPSA